MIRSWVPSRNHLSRLTPMPKRHLADPVLTPRLFGMGEGALLAGATGPATPRDGTLLGQFFESLVTLSVRVYAQAAEARVHDAVVITTGREACRRQDGIAVVPAASLGP